MVFDVDKHFDVKNDRLLTFQNPREKIMMNNMMGVQKNACSVEIGGVKSKKG